MIIGVPLIDIALIISMVFAYKKCECKCELSAIIFFFLLGILLITNALSILFFYVDFNKK